MEAGQLLGPRGKWPNAGANVYRDWSPFGGRASERGFACARGRPPAAGPGIGGNSRRSELYPLMALPGVCRGQLVAAESCRRTGQEAQHGGTYFSPSAAGRIPAQRAGGIRAQRLQPSAHLPALASARHSPAGFGSRTFVYCAYLLLSARARARTCPLGPDSGGQPRKMSPRFRL